MFSFFTASFLYMFFLIQIVKHSCTLMISICAQFFVFSEAVHVCDKVTDLTHAVSVCRAAGQTEAVRHWAV